MIDNGKIRIPINKKTIAISSVIVLVLGGFVADLIALGGNSIHSVNQSVTEKAKIIPIVTSETDKSQTKGSKIIYVQPSKNNVKTTIFHMQSSTSKSSPSSTSSMTLSTQSTQSTQPSPPVQSQPQKQSILSTCSYSAYFSSNNGTISKTFTASSCSEAKSEGSAWVKQEQAQEQAKNAQSQTLKPKTTPTSTTTSTKPNNNSSGESPSSNTTSQPTQQTTVTLSNGCQMPASFPSQSDFISWWDNQSVACQTGTFNVTIAGTQQTFTLTAQ